MPQFSEAHCPLSRSHCTGFTVSMRSISDLKTTVILFSIGMTLGCSPIVSEFEEMKYSVQNSAPIFYQLHEVSA